MSSSNERTMSSSVAKSEPNVSVPHLDRQLLETELETSLSTNREDTFIVETRAKNHHADSKSRNRSSSASTEAASDDSPQSMRSVQLWSDVSG